VKFQLLPVVLFVGCAALPPQEEPANYQPHLQRVSAIEHFALTGRIAILTETKGFSGTMRWHHRIDGDDIAFYSPLGTQLGQLNLDASGVTLTTGNRQTYQADDAETLTQQSLGWSLPLDGLPDWVLGRPTAGGAEILAWDAAGRIMRMRQNGWDIEYPLYQEAADRTLPGKVVLKSRKLDLKLVIESWQTDAE